MTGAAPIFRRKDLKTAGYTGQNTFQEDCLAKLQLQKEGGNQQESEYCE